MDRRKGGLKRSVASDGEGIPLGIAAAAGNRHDSPLLRPTLQAASQQLDGVLPAVRACHLDAGYDSTVTRQLLDELGFDGQIARKGVPAPVQAGTRWVIERTHSWMNGYGKLRRCTERNTKIVDFYLYLAAALVTIRQLIQRARNRGQRRAHRERRRPAAAVHLRAGRRRHHRRLPCQLPAEGSALASREPPRLPGSRWPPAGPAWRRAAWPAAPRFAGTPRRQNPETSLVVRGAVACECVRSPEGQMVSRSR